MARISGETPGARGRGSRNSLISARVHSLDGLRSVVTSILRSDKSHRLKFCPGDRPAERIRLPQRAGGPHCGSLFFCVVLSFIPNR
jgi:hypothetical protein